MGPEIVAGILVALMLEMRAAIGRIGKRVGAIETRCDKRHSVGKLAGAGIALLILGACAVPVRAYPPRDAEGKPTALPVVIVKDAAAPVEPKGFDWLAFLTIAGTVVAGGGIGGVAVRTFKRPSCRTPSTKKEA